MAVIEKYMWGAEAPPPILYSNCAYEEHLTGLALLNIYRDVIVDLIHIVNKLTQHRQRLNLLI